MIRRMFAIAIIGGLAAAGCANDLGKNLPGCDAEEINNAIILTAQSVRGAAYVPCINELKPGWQYEDLEARTGQTRFWISSDRVGNRFLEVTFAGSCDLSGAVEAPSDEPDIPLFMEETESDLLVRITVIPEGDETEPRDYAVAVALEAGAMRSGNRLVRAALDSTDLPTAERIRLALDDGQAVMVVGAREFEEGSVELQFLKPGQTEPTVMRGLSVAEAVEEAAEPLGDPHYRAAWYYPFENGCVTYRLDARGAGADRIGFEVKNALSFLPLAPIRELGEQNGYVLP